MLRDLDCHRGSVSWGINLVLPFSPLYFLHLSKISHLWSLCIEMLLQNKGLIFEMMFFFEFLAYTLHVIVIISHDLSLNIGS